MLFHWEERGRLALLAGIPLFLVLFVPGLVWHYRRYGRPSLARLVGLAMVCLYVTAVVAYTTMPLPDSTGQWCQSHSAGRNTTPLRFLAEILTTIDAVGRRAALRSSVFLQAVLNVAFFVPFGVIGTRNLRWRTSVVVGLAALVSVGIEVTQAVGIPFLYPCPYRVADVDDIILNTTGSLLGVLLAPVLLWWMPSARSLSRGRLQPRPVTAARRWTGMVVDVMLAAVLGAGTTWVVRAVRILAGAPHPSFLETAEFAAGLLVALVCVFLGPAWNGRGSTIGQASVWLAPTWGPAGPTGSADRGAFAAADPAAAPASDAGATRARDGHRWQRLLCAGGVPTVVAACLLAA
ncbi:MAG: VanZ family protein, partial [Pauljensenia sp.]